MVPFLPLASLNSKYTETFLSSLPGLLQRDSLILGDAVADFEAEFSAYCGVEWGLGVGNGLDALRLCLLAAEIGPGDEVLVPSNTFIATFLAISSVGARPVPVEPDPVTFCLDPDRLTSSLTSRSRAIMPVHLYGRLSAMEEICEFARENNLIVIEDAAQAHGAAWRGRRAGAFGHMAAFSFYPGKNLGGLGDGGFVASTDRRFTDKIRLLRNYGSPQKYIHDSKAGMNSRLDTIQAAFLRVKLHDLDRCNAARRDLASFYQHNIDNTAITLPEHPDEGESHVWHLYVVRTQEREDLRRHLAECGVQTLIHYPIAPHRQAAYSELAHRLLPISEALHATVLSLPMYPDMPEDHRRQVADALNAWRPTLALNT